jgi:hypothetical protein
MSEVSHKTHIVAALITGLFVLLGALITGLLPIWNKPPISGDPTPTATPLASDSHSARTPDNLRAVAGISRWNNFEGGRAKLYGAYQIEVPKGSDWLPTDIQLQPGMEIRANFEDLKSPEKLNDPLQLQAGKFAISYYDGWGGSAFYQVYLTKSSKTCKGCSYMPAPAPLEVRSPERGVRFRVELYSSTK